MNNTQKAFTIQIKTTNTNIDRDTIREFLNNAIVNSEFSEDLIYSVDENIGILFNFLNDLMAFSFFIRKTKEDFLEEYPYFAEEYDFCLSEFNKDRDNALLTFLENTSTQELTEPYGLTPEDFSFSVGMYIKNNMTPEEQIEFLKKVASKGLKVEIY
jgi:hypothetical protein